MFCTIWSYHIRLYNLFCLYSWTSTNIISHLFTISHLVKYILSFILIWTSFQQNYVWIIKKTINFVINILNIILKSFISNFSVFKKPHNTPRIFLRWGPGIWSKINTLHDLQMVKRHQLKKHLLILIFTSEGPINLLISIWLLNKRV